MSEETYVLDANIFIDAARMYYAFDLLPRFWNILNNQAYNGRILSIDRVKAELEKGSDDLAEWVKNVFNHAFASTDDDDVVHAYANVMNWVNDQNQFYPAVKNEFANGADGWLVAYAAVKGGVIVTHEKANPEIKRKVPLPNVCKAFDVPFTGLFEMLRNLNVRLE